MDTQGSACATRSWKTWFADTTYTPLEPLAGMSDFLVILLACTLEHRCLCCVRYRCFGAGHRRSCAHCPAWMWGSGLRYTSEQGRNCWRTNRSFHPRITFPSSTLQCKLVWPSSASSGKPNGAPRTMFVSGQATHPTTQIACKSTSPAGGLYAPTSTRV